MPNSALKAIGQTDLRIVMKNEYFGLGALNGKILDFGLLKMLSFHF